MIPSPTSTLLALALCTVPQQLGSGTRYLTNESFPFDNVAGRLVAFATSPIHPMAFSRSGSALYAVNQPGARLEILDPVTLGRLGQVQIGLGAVSVVQRPGSREVWVVDAVDSCVSVVDTALRAVVRTIRVGSEPHGLVFTHSGDRAYVTCSAVDSVDVIDARLYQVVKSIPIPARNPRGIAYLDGKAYVVSFLSGNGTAPRGTATDPDAVDSIGVPASPQENALPDCDLFVIPSQATPQQDDLDPSGTLSGLGTILFNIHARPGTTELWIPNTDALNAVHRGEVNFVAGQVVHNRITIVDATGAAPPRIIDLDAIAPPDHKCAQPAYVEFDSQQPFAYVCGYGSDLVAVLRLGSGGSVTWEGSIELPSSKAYPRGTGPRSCLVDRSRTALFVFNKNDDSATRINFSSLPQGSGWTVTAPAATPLGLDLSSGFVRLGRHLFTNARFSLSQTSSCASCHVDGHTDGLVWDLSHYLDPEGTPDDQLAYGTDVKGPMVTQSVRRMEDGGPYHWRGEIESTNGFQNAFVALLENTVNGVPQTIGPDFQYLRHFIDTLTGPPNPRQTLDRRFTDEQLRGATLFLTRPVQGELTCASCHALPLGSSGEIEAESAGGVIRSADVPSLRGVADKLSKRFSVGGPYGDRTELGAGLTHGGAIGTVKEAFFRSAPTGGGHHSFVLAPQEAHLISSFLSAFDTGVAPAAGLMVTANAGNWASVAAQELPLLRDAAARGHCDLVYYRVPRVVLGRFAELAGTYDPAAGNYRVASASGAPIDEQTLLSEAASGLPVTFLGVPIGMGESQGLDRDMDGLFDLDEIVAQTDPENWDSDGDDFADGYEVQWGMDPLHATSSSPDTQAPALVGPVRLSYATTNTLKFEFDTSEFCKVSISYNGNPPVARVPFNKIGDHRHWVVLGDLDPDTDYQIALEMRDAAGNVAVDSSTRFRTRPRATPDPVHVGSIALSSIQLAPGSPGLRSVVTIDRGLVPGGSGYAVKAAVYQLDAAGSLHMIQSEMSVRTNSVGTAIFTVGLPPAGSSPGMVYFVVKGVVAPPSSPPWVRGLDAQTTATMPY